MISLNSSGFACFYNEKALENLKCDKGGKKEFSCKRSRRGQFYNIVSCLHHFKEIKTFWTFSVPELQTDYKNTDKFYSGQFQKLLEGLSLRNKRGKANGLENYVWVSEAQKRGNIHFHLVTSSSFIDIKYVNDYWCKLIGQPSKNAVDVEFIKSQYIDRETGEVVDNSIRNISGYFAKYMSKGHKKDVADDSLKSRIIYSRSFGYSRNFPIFEKMKMKEVDFFASFPGAQENKVTKLVNDYEVNYFFVDSKNCYDLIKNSNDLAGSVLMEAERFGFI